MKNVSYLTKLRRLIKSLAVSFVFLFLGVAGSSFTIFSSGSSNEEVKKSGRDSELTDKNTFPSLVNAGLTDPDNFYAPLLNPKAKAFVLNFVQDNSDRLNKMKVWGKPYFDIFDGILAQHGLPKQLKYLSVVESSLVQRALSSAGAVGPWQIMATEARSLGLKVNSKVDERKNYYKSTHAAAKFMKELYGSFHDWLLVIAAYNCGPNRVQQAIRKSGSRDFWVLQKYLPLETRIHVKKYIGTHYTFEGSGGVTTMTAAEVDDYNVSVAALKAKTNLTEEELNRTMSVELKGKYNSSVLAKQVGLEHNEFIHLNPGFDKIMAKGSANTLRLPVDKMIIFDHKKQLILDESVKTLIN